MGETSWGNVSHSQGIVNVYEALLAETSVFPQNDGTKGLSVVLKTLSYTYTTTTLSPPTQAAVYLNDASGATETSLLQLVSSWAFGYVVAIHSIEQSSVHFCDIVKVTVSPSMLLIVIGFSIYLVLPSVSVSRTPMTQISEGKELGTALGDKLGS